MSYIRFVIKVVLLLVLIIPSATGFAALRTGDNGDDVLELQERLAALEYEVTTDGSYGPVTENSVRKFQQEHGLEIDGIVGSGTWEVLERLSPTVSRSSRPFGDRLTAVARQYIGIPYSFGGTGPGGFDCSGFTQYVFSRVGINLYRTADAQYEQGRHVDSLHAGDLVFFSTYEVGPSHVGIYINNGQFIHSGTSTGVTVSSLNDGYWGSRYIGAKRIIR